MGIFEQIKQAVTTKDIVEKYYAKLNRNNKVCCPFHQEKTPSLSVDTKENMWKCFGCGAGGDSIRFLSRLKGIEDFEAAKVVIDDFRLSIDYEGEFRKTPQGEIREYIKQSQKHIVETNYFKKRGLTDETVRVFGLGFDTKEKAVVIPYSPKLVYYQLRYVDGRRFYKPKSDKFGAEPLWHPECLEIKNKSPIFVAESPICAMSIAQYGGVAVALCGVSNAKRFAEEVIKKKPHGILVICMDNDEAGKSAEKELVIAFKNTGIKHIVFNVAGECNDPNELLLKSANQLCRNIAKATKQAVIASRERKDRICIQELSELGIKPKPYIVENMIPEDALCLLVAASKVGKSWFVLQLAIAIVMGKDFLGEQTNKHKVLYYALEDNESRMIWRKNTLTDNQPVPKQWLQVKLETDKGNLDTGFMDELRQQVREIEGLKLIIIDTLQMVRGTPRRNEGTYAWDNREMAAFRKFCSDNHVSILFVHHTRKQEDEHDSFNAISGSMAIMGAADASFVITKKKRMDNNEPYKFSQTGRDVKQCERFIERSEQEGRWSKVGNAEEQFAKREAEAFNNSKSMRLVLELLLRQPSGWQGTTKDFVKHGIDIFGELIGTEVEVGREINRFEIELLKRHKINHECKRSNRGNKHIFKPHNPYSLFNHGDPNI